MISLGTLQSLWRSEKNSSKIQKLPSDFDKQIEALLNDDRVGEYRENIKEVLRQLKRERRNKILRHCMGPHPENPPENLSENEGNLYRKLNHTLSCYEEDPDESIPSCPAEITTPRENARFIRDMPQFKASDGRLLGPFKSGEKTQLPAETLKILNTQGVVEKL
ncbi:MAG: hypothetical protein GF334_05615 [Candidatus Altiarchaeales archaeon]|nr:hypothetical protein [Candidatus Altiarchaeales archaeon]